MTKEQIDKLAEALRSQGLTWGQVNFAVSLVRNAACLEREACAKVADAYHIPMCDTAADAIAAAIRARGNETRPSGRLSPDHYVDALTDRAHITEPPCRPARGQE